MKNRIPAISLYRRFAEGGGLLAYGPDVNDMRRRATAYVDKILKGPKLGDLPVMAKSSASGDVHSITGRRAFLGAMGSAFTAASFPTFAQRQPPILRRIGFLGSESASNQAQRLEALRAGLRELGYTEGSNIVIEVRWAEGNYDRLPA